MGMIKGKTMRWLGFLVLCGTLVNPAWVSADPADQRLAPSGLNTRFDPGADTFPEYVKRTRDMIEQARVFTPGQDRQALIEGNAPFILYPDSGCREQASGGGKGILLAHGLTDSPYLMGHLAHHLQKLCFTVQVVLLPGHGTRPGDLLDVQWQEWAKAFAFGVNTLRTHVDEVYLGGFSTGGTLAIQYAMGHEHIKALLLFSPAVAITPFARASCWLAAAGNLVPGLAWLGKTQPDEDTFKYESFSANAACQIFRLTREIRAVKRDAPLRLPVFVAASADDATVSADATLAFFDRVENASKHMLLYARSYREVPAAVQIVDSRVADQHIVSSAHTAMLIPPNDVHYGAAGDYAFCTTYYGKDPQAYGRCKARAEDMLGETSKEFLKQGVVRRLTYNPHYEAMIREIDAFLASVR